jgi:homocysteine S-methyltransferase
MNPLQPYWDTQRLVVLDGGLATELERMGHKLSDSLWSARLLVEEPEAIQAVHRTYLEAGADIITTSSYQANIPAFVSKGYSKAQSEALLLLSYKLAEETVEQFIAENPGKALRPLIAASIGPYGAFLADGSEYIGKYAFNEDELLSFHRPKLEVLYAAGARFFAFETIPNRSEAVVLSNLLKEFPNAMAWMSFSCLDEKNISDGTPLCDCFSELESNPQIVAIGINCTAPHLISSLLRNSRYFTTKPIIVYPNSGDDWDAHLKCWVENKSQVDFLEQAKEWMSFGAKIIGGCCRITPEIIEKIAREKYSIQTHQAMFKK